MSNQTLKIYRCYVSFIYTQYYIKVTLITINKTEAKKKFIARCLEEYDLIVKHIDFEQFYDKYECDTMPLKFDNAEVFEKWLNDNIDENNPDDIECINDCNFEIVNKYE